MNKSVVYKLSVFKISAGPWTLTGKIWVGPASFPSVSYMNFGKIVLRSAKFQILFWRLNYDTCNKKPAMGLLHKVQDEFIENEEKLVYIH